MGIGDVGIGAGAERIRCRTTHVEVTAAEGLTPSEVSVWGLRGDLARQVLRTGQAVEAEEH
jgi:hypothetical protein